MYDQRERNDVMNQPAYRQLYKKIKSDIERGSYSSGSFIPTEPELEQLFGVSRTTVRKAMKLLADEQLVEIKQGRGTMVLDTSTTQRLNSITSITETLIKRGYKVTTEGTSIEIVDARPAVASALEVPIGTEVYLVQRVQYADGVPIAIIKNYLKTNELPGLQAKAGSLVGLYNMLEKDYNIILTNATEHISAISADFTESQILRIPLNSPLLLVRRISCTEQGPIEYASIKIVADKYEYSVYLEGRK